MKNLFKSITVVLAIALFLAIPAMGQKVSADTISQVSVEKIDYELLEMTINKNGNAIVYFSTDNKRTYNEVEGVKTSDTITMDISWASAGSNVVIYLKGDVNQEVLKVTLPKQATTFKVVFDKVNNDFTYTGQEDRSYFYFRKSTDYNWQAVSFTESVPSGVPGCIPQSAFLGAIPQYRFKGTKLVFRLGQVIGNGTDFGDRPGKEITVTVSKYTSAPAVKPNLSNLKFNTRSTMEYSTDMGQTWTSCDNNMTLAELAPAAEAGTDVIMLIRSSATDKKPESLTRYLKIPGRGTAPAYGTDYSISYANGKTVLSFLTASKDTPMEYSICKTGDFDESTARWTGCSLKKDIKLTAAQCPDGAVIYVRFKGIAENVSKKIDLKMPSKTSSVVVNIQ